MTSGSPAVSIIVAAHDDEPSLSRSLESCVRQSLVDVEILCVAGAASKSLRTLMDRISARDSRVRVVEDPSSSPAQMWVGASAATAPYVVFLDKHDELAPRAVEIALARATKTGADVVGLGIENVVPQDRAGSTVAAAKQPPRASQEGPTLLATLFGKQAPARGHLWGYLLASEIVREACESVPTGEGATRADDRAIAFLTIARASRYACSPARLYRRFTLGSPTDLESVTAFESIAPAVTGTTAEWPDAGMVASSYDLTRLSVIADALGAAVNAADEHLAGDRVAQIEQQLGRLDIVRAAATFLPAALPAIVSETPRSSLPAGGYKHALLATSALSTGGIQGVVVSQARYLLEAGFQVSIALHRKAEAVYALPPEVRVFQVEGEELSERLSSWVDICERSGADVVFDHTVLYDRIWPYFALAARTAGVATIGFLQSFALRPLRNDNRNTSFLVNNLSLVDTVVTLSATDVAFWKLRGIQHVVSLPIPPSPMQLALTARTEPRTPPTGTVNLIWWGRLQESVKQVRSLIPVTAALRERGVDAELTIIGPDSGDLTAAELADDAAAAGIGDSVHLAGELHGQALIDATAKAHVYVLTSVIEGSPLVLAEAQTLGLPVAMFELPWLANLDGNKGVVASSQHDAHGLAREIHTLVSDPAVYTARSEASLEASRRAIDLDFAQLYAQLLTRQLGPEFSPEPTMEHVRLILKWTTFYAEINSARHAKTRRDLRAAQGQIEVLRAQAKSGGNGAAAIASSPSLRSQLARVKRGLSRRLRGKG